VLDYPKNVAQRLPQCPGKRHAWVRLSFEEFERLKQYAEETDRLI